MGRDPEGLRVKLMVQLLYRCWSLTAPVAFVKENFSQLNVINVYLPAQSKQTSYLNFNTHLERFQVKGFLICAVFQNSVSVEVDKLTFMIAIALLRYFCVCAFTIFTDCTGKFGSQNNKINYVLTWVWGRWIDDRIGTCRLHIKCILRRKSSCQLRINKVTCNKATDLGQQAVKRSYCYWISHL